MAKTSRRTYAEKMAAMKRDAEHKEERKTSAQDRFGETQRKLKADFLGRSKAPSAARLETA